MAVATGGTLGGPARPPKVPPIPHPCADIPACSAAFTRTHASQGAARRRRSGLAKPPAKHRGQVAKRAPAMTDTGHTRRASVRPADT